MVSNKLQGGAFQGPNMYATLLGVPHLHDSDTPVSPVSQSRIVWDYHPLSFKGLSRLLYPKQ